MREEIDKTTGEKWIVLDEEEIKMGFLAQCIEKLAEKEGADYLSIFERMEKADMTEGFILKHYNALHSDSMENIIETLHHLLHKREMVN